MGTDRVFGDSGSNKFETLNTARNSPSNFFHEHGRDAPQRTHHRKRVIRPYVPIDEEVRQSPAITYEKEPAKPSVKHKAALKQGDSDKYLIPQP